MLYSIDSSTHRTDTIYRCSFEVQAKEGAKMAWGMELHNFFPRSSSSNAFLATISILRWEEANWRFLPSIILQIQCVVPILEQKRNKKRFDEISWNWVTLSSNLVGSLFEFDLRRMTFCNINFSIRIDIVFSRPRLTSHTAIRDHYDYWPRWRAFYYWEAGPRFLMNGYQTFLLP